MPQANITKHIRYNGICSTKYVAAYDNLATSEKNERISMGT